MSMIYKYSFDAKIEAVRLYIRLKNAAEAGRILNVSSSLILMWHRQFYAKTSHFSINF
jgi:transposase-like protein